MPNHVRNRIDLKGPEEIIERLISEAVEHVPMIHHTNGPDGPPLFTDNEGLGFYAEDEWGTIVNVHTGMPCFRKDELKPFTDGPFDNLDFNVFQPMPDHIREGSGEAFCGWASEHWGAKWNAYEGRIEREEGKVVIFFNTAWAPPKPVIQALAARYPELEGEHCYVEEGGESWGSVEVSSGHTLHRIDRKIEEYAPMYEDRYGDALLRRLYHRVHGVSIDIEAREQFEGQMPDKDIEIMLAEYARRGGGDTGIVM